MAGRRVKLSVFHEMVERRKLQAGSRFGGMVGGAFGAIVALYSVLLLSVAPAVAEPEPAMVSEQAIDADSAIESVDIVTNEDSVEVEEGTAIEELTSAALPIPSQTYSETREPCATQSPLKKPFFGDLHVHTRYSLDASTQGTRTTPEQAYQFARGERIPIQPWTESGEALRSLQLSRPLDFAMVSDHAELIGEVYMCNTPEYDGYKSWQCIFYRNWSRGAFYLFNYMATMEQAHMGQCGEDGERCLEAALLPWQEMQEAAERYYDRSEDCEFTTFVGYEWTGMNGSNGGNLHRNVVFRNAEVPELPTSFIDAPAAHLLWDSLEENCNGVGNTCESLVIPHNSNYSAGSMFSGLTDDGAPMTEEYALSRARFEPLVEIMQHKGSSECFFQAGVTEDELCAFEQLPKDNIAGFNDPPTPDTGFVRKVLADGMVIENTLGINPYRLGVIASTDTHLGTPGAAREDLFLGHGGAGVPAETEIPPGLPDELEYNPGGLAVLWAHENSRDALFDAMQRRETYGTSGPRITSRFFAGWDFPADLCGAPDRIARGYADGVPMGSMLPARPGAQNRPTFLVAASQDAGTSSEPGTPLQRLQVIKGWVDAGGERHERVIDVAGNANNGASVDVQSCATSGSGFADLCAVWEDTDFDPNERAYYYSRVVENPTCRWSQRMCAAAGVDCARPDTITEGYEGCCSAEHRPIVQERAWTSPVWYSPTASAAGPQE
ncbi:Uncharacterised protein [Halioglobus japonicus]|nr:Uncharacterised protein [Halioglobus japonicus]